MLASEQIKRGIESTQEEWESMSFKQKRKQILGYWEGKLDTETDKDRLAFVHKQIIITESLDEPEIVEYVENIHKAIIDHARKLMQEAQERERE